MVLTKYRSCSTSCYKSAPVQRLAASCYMSVVGALSLLGCASSTSALELVESVGLVGTVELARCLLSRSREKKARGTRPNMASMMGKHSNSAKKIS